MSAILLSIVIPFYKKMEEFPRVLELNRVILRREEYEVILCLDEPSEAEEVLRCTRLYPEIKWRILVNLEKHEWRPPCKAINVGLRHAQGKFSLIVSPESAFVTDVPGILLSSLDSEKSATVGKVNRTSFEHLTLCDGLEHAMLTALRQYETHHYYGSILSLTQNFHAVTGYDETLTKYGGDDNNIRARLELIGVKIKRCPEAKILHLTETMERPPDHVSFNKTKEELEYLLQPTISAVNGDAWGKDFSTILYDWAS